MTEPAWDVAVLGGGPAGAVAARLLATWGHSVVLLTRPALSRSLAESLPPSCIRILDHLGIRPAVDQAGFIRSTGNTVWWGPGAGRQEPFTGLPGYQVLRSRFDRLLLDLAAQAGATVRRAVVIREVLPPDQPGGPRRVRYDSQGLSRTLQAAWVIDCTGRSGIVARRGWRQTERPLRTTALIALWERPDGWDLPDHTHTVVESHGDGWVWSVPLSHTRRHVAVMVDPTVTRLTGRGRLTAAFESEVAKTVQLDPMLASARRVGLVWARDASPYAARQVGEPGLLLAGDAASFSDPLSSYGIKKAMASGWLAAVVARTGLGDTHLVQDALELFERRERSMAASLQRQAADLAAAAAGSEPWTYWTRRAVQETDGDERDEALAFRDDEAVQAAFRELKRRDRIRLRPTRVMQLAPRPIVRADRIAREPHLVGTAFGDGVRYLRAVDLVLLAELAPTHYEVPALFEAYRRAAGPVPLPDFLGALSVLIGKGPLELA